MLSEDEKFLADGIVENFTYFFLFTKQMNFFHI